MDPLTGSLVNFGGMGILAAVLFVLHREALKAFREEQRETRNADEARWKETRATDERRWQALLDLKLRQHQEVTALMVGTRAHLDDSLDKTRLELLGEIRIAKHGINNVANQMSWANAVAKETAKGDAK